MTSDYRIIETMKIKTEADIDNIISRGFVEGHVCAITLLFRYKITNK